MGLTAGGVGTLTVDGRARKALRFTEALEATHPDHVRVLTGRPGRALTEEAAKTRRLAWLFVDANGDGRFEGIGRNPEFFALSGPFAIAGRRFEASYSTDGTALTLTSSDPLPPTCCCPPAQSPRISP